MTEPIDHRALAERALAEATEVVDTMNTTHGEDMLGWALIGIGHAILAAFPDDDGGYEGLPPGTTEEPE
jgi:hypothetical protein